MVETDTTIVPTGKERTKNIVTTLVPVKKILNFPRKRSAYIEASKINAIGFLGTCFRNHHNRTRKGNAAKNLGAVRHIVLNIIKDDPDVKGSPSQDSAGPS